MNKIILILCMSSACIASEKAVQQTFLPSSLPSITSDLLAAKAQLVPQTKSYHETHEQEVARLTEQITNLMSHAKKLEAALESYKGQLNAQGDQIELLSRSVSNLLYVSKVQKAQLVEKEDLLARATAEIASWEQETQERNKRISKIIAHGYEKLAKWKTPREKIVVAISETAESKDT